MLRHVAPVAAALSLVLLGSVLWLGPLAPSAAQETDDLQAKLDDKLAKSFVTHGNWITDYDEARRIAKEEGKLMFVYFTRSYAP